MRARPGFPEVRLRKNLARRVRQGHPWIYRDALRTEAQAADGALVRLATGDGRVLGSGFWSERGPLALRMLALHPSTDITGAVLERVTEALRKRLAWLPAGDDVFRWIHGEADGLPGVHVDVYGAFASIRFDGAGARAFYCDVLPELPRRLLEIGRAELRLRGVVERERERERERRRAAREADPAGAAVLCGEAPPPEVEVIEGGLRFGVDLVRGQKGGLFLDQRENRAAVRVLAAGRRVLNLFAYTGGFSVYAAAGGAKSTTTVDVAAPAIAAARENFRRNGLPIAPAARARFVAADAFAFLDEARRSGERWDLVISDPPSFAPKQSVLSRAMGAYRRLHRLAAGVIEPGGIFCAASCSSHVSEKEFLETVRAGCAEAGRRFHLREMRGAAFDHPMIAAFPEGRYLKMAIGEVG